MNKRDLDVDGNTSAYNQYTRKAEDEEVDYNIVVEGWDNDALFLLETSLAKIIKTKEADYDFLNVWDELVLSGSEKGYSDTPSFEKFIEENSEHPGLSTLLFYGAEDSETQKLETLIEKLSVDFPRRIASNRLDSEILKNTSRKKNPEIKQVFLDKYALSLSDKPSESEILSKYETALNLIVEDTKSTIEQGDYFPMKSYAYAAFKEVVNGTSEHSIVPSPDEWSSRLDSSMKKVYDSGGRGLSYENGANEFLSKKELPSFSSLFQSRKIADAVGVSLPKSGDLDLNPSSQYKK